MFESACRTTTFLTYSGRRSQDLKDAAIRPAAAVTIGMTTVAEAGDSELLESVPAARVSGDGKVVVAPVIAEEVEAVRAALLKQQAQEVPEDERWAVQVGRAHVACRTVLFLNCCFVEQRGEMWHRRSAVQVMCLCPPAINHVTCTPAHVQ